MFTKTFGEVSKKDIAVAGGKGASLGEMTSTFAKATTGQASGHNPVPAGFVMLASAFERFLAETDLGVEIDSVLHTVKHTEMHTTEYASEKIQALILGAKIPKDIAEEIQKEFVRLDAQYVAVRSSATAEDSTSAAWAGQLDSFLNTTEKDLLKNVQKCWASLFTPRAIFYRFEKGLHGHHIGVAVVIQKMVESEVSGIAFSVHPVTEDRNQLIIEAGFGLGEAVVSGQVTPDSYVVEKQPRRILDKNISVQERGLFRSSYSPFAKGRGPLAVRDLKSSASEDLGTSFKKGGTKDSPSTWVVIPKAKGNQQKLSDTQILELSELILKIEQHYGFPCDIEWAFAVGKFYILQSRPITTLKKENFMRTVPQDAMGKYPQGSFDIFERVYSSHWFITNYNALGFVFDFPKLGAGSFITKVIFVMENAMCRYIFDIDEFEKAANFTSERLINDDAWRLGLYRKIDFYTKRYFHAGERLRKLKLSTLTDKEIIGLVRKIIPLQHWHKVYSVVANGVVLDGRNHLSNKIREELKISMGSPQNFDEEWSVLSQITTMSLRQEKEYAIARLAKNHKNLKLAEKKLKRIHEKYCWLDYNNQGPAASFNSFCAELREAIRDNKSIHVRRNLADLKKRQKEIMRKFHPTKRGRFLVSLSQRVISQKSFRKDMEYHGFYCYENLFRELARRNETSDWQAFSYLFPWEVPSHVLSNEPSLEDLKKRREYSCFAVTKKEQKMLVGNEARDFMKKLRINEDFSALTEVQGQCAFSGKVTGTVKIIQVPKDLTKMNSGDILISQATSPDLLSAMKKAGAIVTNTGGLICHAAITSRELKIPCIVGTGKATLIFKDGDMVEVDADKGVVRILQSRPITTLKK